MSNLSGFEDSPVSAATIGAGIGIFLGPLGVLGGSFIGGVVDVYFGAKAAAKARRKMKRAFVSTLLKRYDTQVFISSLQRMASAISYLETLGLRPGTPQFDEYLKRTLYSEIGYKGNCELDLYGPAEKGKPRPLLAQIDNKGVLTAHSPNINLDLGPQWNKACKELHQAALKEWGTEQAANMETERLLTEEKQHSQNILTTKLLVNAGVIMLMLGYTLKTKKKLRKLRASHAETK
jgi:hypothetical protein